jgi:transposase
MARPTVKPVCDEAELATLQAWANSRTMQRRMARRAKLVLMSADGMADVEIAKALDIDPNTVALWRKRFISSGLSGLTDSPRSGKPPLYDRRQTRLDILKTLKRSPPKGQAAWDGKALAKELGLSADIVWKILREEGVHLQRQRTWCVSTDPHFAEKAADIIGLYLNPPENAIVLSIDEKPGIQAIERPNGYVLTSNSKIVRGIKSTYIRHGTVNLFAALEIANGIVRSQFTDRKRRIEFLEFID